MRRIFLIALITLGVAPGTWLRTPVSDQPPVAITIERIAGPEAAANPAWERQGLWHFNARHKWFGGFSALLGLTGEEAGPTFEPQSNVLRAFTDRGVRFTFTDPSDEPKTPPRVTTTRQLERSPRFDELWDIESATRDPETGQYWLGYENQHTIQRFTPTGVPDGYRDLEKEVDWGNNSGAEALVRLADGRFVLLPEAKDYIHVYPRDPVMGDAPVVVPFKAPQEGYAAVDASEIGDGRLMVLMRSLRWGVPSFASLIAIGTLPEPSDLERGDTPTFAPELSLDLTGILPYENYEGLALRTREDERLDVWLIADDNFAIQQRTLLAKLIFDPAAHKTNAP